MSLFYRHKISSFFLLLYLLWWIYIIYYILKPPGEPVCDFSSVAFIIITPIWAFIYTCVWLGKYSTAHPAYQQDYLLFIFLCICPLLVSFLWLI
jgi:hypothetical protein